MAKGYWSEVVWNFIGVYIIMHYMVAWRYKISLLVLKNISLVHCTHSWNIIHNSKRNFISPHRHVISSIYTTYTTVINSYSVKKNVKNTMHRQSRGEWERCAEKHNSWPRIYKQYPLPLKKGGNPNICNLKSIS